MSFRFNWPNFDDKFYIEAKDQLEIALNKEQKSKHIADHIFVKELNMGSMPPELEILEICELTTDYFRGIFKLTYHGDSFIELQTKVQANPLHKPIQQETFYPLSRYGRSSIVAADQPLVIPMLLRISDVQLNGILVLAMSKTKGITLVFKNDPLQSLCVSSTFDIVSSIKSFLQQQIETKLRVFLQDTLPLVVHDYSLRHINDAPATKTPILSSKSSSVYTCGTISSTKQHPYYLSEENIMQQPISYTNEDNTGDLLTVPGLISSTSALSATKCYSDTSSVSLSSYFSGDDDSSIRTPLSATLDHSIFNDITDLYDFDSGNSFYSTQHHFPNINKTDSDIPVNFSASDNQIGRNDQNNQQDDNLHPSYANNWRNHSSSRATLYPTSTQSISPTIFFSQPITIQPNQPHNLLQKMTDLSISSHSLSVVCKNSHFNNTIVECLVHKTSIINNSNNNKGFPSRYSRHRIKIPKRRIIRWNA